MSTQDNPFEMIERMFDRMSRQFEEASKAWRTDGPGVRGTGVGMMGIDLADHGDEFVVTVDVPGFEKDEIGLRFADDTLHVKAIHEGETEERGETYLRSERERRSMRESVRLPEPVREGDIEAMLKNGVLTVRLPKAEPTALGGRTVEIE